MNARKIIIDTINHKANDEKIIPYTIYFDDAKLEEDVKNYYGKNLRELTRQFFIHPAGFRIGRKNPFDQKYAMDVYGSIWRIDKRPPHLEIPAMAEPSFKNYEFPDAGSFLEPFEKINKIKLANDEISQNTDLFSITNIALGIFESTWAIRGFENALTDIIAEPDFYSELVGKITDFYVEIVKYTAEIKCDAIMFADDWGAQQGLLMSPDHWRKIIKPAWKKLYDMVHKQGKFVISHCCGSIYEIIPDLTEIGLDMLESVQPEALNMDPFKLKKEFGDKIAFWGTIGSQSVMPFYKPDEITRHIRKLKTEMSVNGGFIAAPSKAIQQGTTLCNVIALIDALRE